MFTVKSLSLLTYLDAICEWANAYFIILWNFIDSSSERDVERGKFVKSFVGSF